MVMNIITKHMISKVKYVSDFDFNYTYMYLCILQRNFTPHVIMDVIIVYLLYCHEQSRVFGQIWRKSSLLFDLLGFFYDRNQLGREHRQVISCIILS